MSKFQINLILTVGLSNSGKTTWATNYVQDNPNTVIISRDTYRFGPLSHIFKDPYATNYEKATAEERIDFYIDEDIDFAISTGKDIIIADSNLNHRTRYKWKMLSLKHNLKLSYVVFYTHYHSLILQADAFSLMDLPYHVRDVQAKYFNQFLQEERNPSEGVLVI